MPLTHWNVAMTSWHVEGAINVWIRHKIDNVSQQTACWTYSAQGMESRRVGCLGVWHVGCRGLLRRLSINFNLSSLTESGPEYEDLQHYDHNYIHHRDFSLITGLCTLNNFSVYLFASLLVGLFIVIMNVCDGENTSEYWLLTSYPYSHFYWLVSPIICGVLGPFNSIITAVSQLMLTSSFETHGMGKS